MRIDRTDTANGIGGGLLVYVRKDVIIKPEEPDENCMFNQYCRFKVFDKSKKNPLNVTLFYRSPNSSHENNVALAALVDNCKKNSFLIGDINYPKLHSLTNNDDITVRPVEKLFANAAENKFLEQIVDFPTHNKGGLLDVVYTDIPESVFNCENIGNLGNSDHAIIKIEIDFSPKFNSTSEKVRDWKRGDTEGLSEHLAGVDFDRLFQDKNVDEAWEAFKTTTDNAIDRYIPLIARRKQGDPPWMTRAVKRIVKKKQRKWRHYTRNRTDAIFEEFKILEKHCRKVVQRAKRKYEKKLAENKNKRPFNAYIKTKTKTRANVGPLKVNNEVITDNKEMATVLNKFFTSVFTKDDPSVVSPIINKLPSYSVLNQVVFEPHKVRKKIDKLRQGSAPGPDGITTTFLKLCADVLSTALAILFNKSMQEGVVPQDWRSANVTPIFKKGVKGNPGNYRPVSLTSIVCKIMESCIRDELVDHLLTNNLINRS